MRRAFLLRLLAFLLLNALALCWPAAAQTSIFAPDLVADKQGLRGSIDLIFADVDLDGDLDIVLSSGGEQGLRYWPNRAASDSRAPDYDPYWEFLWDHKVTAPYYQAIAVGDLDGDGDLDLVGARNRDRVEVFAGEDGSFRDDLLWASADTLDRASIALGDIDNDGDLDLVCGNGDPWEPTWSMEANTLYLNRSAADDSTIFPGTPDWRSDVVRLTHQVALGDLDGDGLLDLVCVDDDIVAEAHQVSVYMNRFGDGVATIYDAEPDSLPGLNTTLALGDLTGDGALDLVSRDADGFLVVLANVFAAAAPTVFDITAPPAWRSPEPVFGDRLFKPALGDIDGDGDLDLCCRSASGFFQVFLNTGGPELFAAEPSQQLGPLTMYSALLVDVNGDGGLDLVCNGNTTANITTVFGIYLNNGITFPHQPSEPSFLIPSPTQSVALGPIDDDEWPDLVCGCGATWNTAIYRNDAGVLENIPSPWVPLGQYDTRVVALALVDGDDRLDLVCGNESTGNTVFLNEPGGYFATSPGWVSNETERTRSIALGDINSDGRSDLVCGNYGARNRLYENLGAAFSLAGMEICTEERHTTGVALGDMDNDGDLDLVCGNDGERNTLYLNRGGVFDAAFVWESYEPDSTTSVALGDVDRDGYLDLVCGNGSDGVAVYFNGNGAMASGFNTHRVHLDPALETISVESIILKDLDGDGDLDLLCGNRGAPNTLHWNVEGRFNPTPVWLSSTVGATTSLALGDLNLDGDFDLVCGNFDQVNTVYAARRNPTAKHDPTAPIYQLVNSDAFVSRVDLVRGVDNEYEVSFTAVDAESDDVWILPEFQYEPVCEWMAPVLRDHPEGGPLGPLSASPAGEPHTFGWDVSQIDFDPRNVILRLRTISQAGKAGAVQRVTVFQKEIGPLAIRRPEIAVSPETIAFATVTLGDTVQAAFRVANPGNEPLAVSGVVPPSDEIERTGPSEFTVAPGQVHEDTLMLLPRLETSVSGSLEITSSAPRSPVLIIPVEAEILPLTHNLEVVPLLEGDMAPLGQALTVQVMPGARVHIERCALHYRAATRSAPFTSAEASPSGRSFIAVIPGQNITEDGLEYYVELENSDVFATSPPDAAGGNYYTLDVKAPESVLADAVPNAEAGYVENRPVWVEVTLPSGANFDSGALHYRRGGEADFRSIGLAQAGLAFTAAIPDTCCGPRGVEFWVEVRTSSGVVLTDPSVEPASSPHCLAVTTPDFQEATVTAAGAYRMVTVPVSFGAEFTGTLAAILSDQAEFGSYDPMRWRSFRWDPGMGRYVEHSEEAYAAMFRPEPGRAFWLVCREVSRITTAPLIATSIPTDHAYSLELEPGWNQVGNPFAFPVPWDSVGVAEPEIASLSTLVEPPVVWVNGVGYQGSVQALEPWQGYWVKNISEPPRTVVLKVPARQAPVAPRAEAHRHDGWRLVIRAAAAGACDGNTYLGCAAAAESGWDQHDRSDPPLAPGQGLSVYFPHAEWISHPGRYTADIRSPIGTPGGSRGHRWSFDVAKNFRGVGPGNMVELRIDGLGDIPERYGASLLDRELARVQDLRERPSYVFHLGAREPVATDADARFVVLVGDPEFVDAELDDLATPPLRTTLHQNYPNPFNPETVIRWDVAETGRVDLQIYDLAGALVKTVNAGVLPPGGYEFVWRGDDNSGRRVASGVYVYRLRAGDVVATKRMMLIK